MSKTLYLCSLATFFSLLSFSAAAAIEPGISDRYKPAKPPLEVVDNDEIEHQYDVHERRKRNRLQQILRNHRLGYYEGASVSRRLSTYGRQQAVREAYALSPTLGDTVNHMLWRQRLNSDDLIDIILR